MLTREHFEKCAEELTPWENREGVWFKRDDYHAPLGYGGPNGSKLRQLVHLFKNYRGNATRVITAASVLSPQHSMTGIVARVYGLPSLHIIASPKPEAHPNTLIAKAFGAKFHNIKVGYNPMLQKELERIKLDSDFIVPYGITTEDPERVEAFHEVGAKQVENLPNDVHVLYIPAGSCNSLTSVLKGLARNPRNVRQLISIGIGPEKIEWTKSRLRVMGIDPDRLPFKWDNSISLHERGVKYGDKVKENFAGITFHPTYEGKAIRFMKQENRLKPDENIGFWIVGSAPDPQVALSEVKK